MTWSTWCLGPRFLVQDNQFSFFLYFWPFFPPFCLQPIAFFLASLTGAEILSSSETPNQNSTMKQKPMDTAETSMITSLPAELKLKILGFLPGLEIAKVGCLCSELRDLSSADDLWKQKFEEEFGQGSAENGMTGFKDLFAQHWKRKKNSAQSVHVASLHCLTCFSTMRDFYFNPFCPASSFREYFDSSAGFRDPPYSRFRSPQVFLPNPDPPYTNFQL